MTRVNTFSLFFVLFVASSFSLRTTTTIDGWGPVTAPLILSLDSEAPPEQSVFESTSFNTILGGERDVQITAIEGSQSVVAFSQINEERLSFAAPSQMIGSFLLQWDGEDNSPTRNPGGLGGIDFTLDGGDRFQFVIETDVEAVFYFRIYTGDNLSTFVLNVDRELGERTYTPLFSQFEGNADFTRVDTFELFTEFDGDLDFSIFKIDIALDESTESDSPVTFSPVSFSPVSVPSESPISFSPVSVPSEESTPDVGRIEFVRPIAQQFIDFNHQCERLVQFDDDDSSSPAGCLTLSFFLSLTILFFL